MTMEECFILSNSALPLFLEAFFGSGCTSRSYQTLKGWMQCSEVNFIARCGIAEQRANRRTGRAMTFPTTLQTIFDTKFSTSKSKFLRSWRAVRTLRPRKARKDNIINQNRNEEKRTKQVRLGVASAGGGWTPFSSDSSLKSISSSLFPWSASWPSTWAAACSCSPSPFLAGAVA